ncbi:MAG: VCBS repeat-containing protein, partial [Flavobacteriales bacterium]|nr:VCBS repeat-containing protein [Flavobacteriales bacterium]
MLSTSAAAQSFEDITSTCGVFAYIQDDVTGNGLSFYDWNKDGLDDLSFCQVGTSPQFFLNNGDETFTEMSSFFNSNGVMRQLSWVDFDNDGDADIFVAYDGSPLRLYENDGDLNFTNVAQSAGFPTTYVRNYGFCWGDYDQDGWLDVYVSSYWDPTFDQSYETENHLYHNNGDGTFSDVTIETNTSDGYTSTLAPIWWDYDNDGDADLYVV